MIDNFFILIKTHKNVEYRNQILLEGRTAKFNSTELFYSKKLLTSGSAQANLTWTV